MLLNSSPLDEAPCWWWCCCTGAGGRRRFHDRLVGGGPGAAADGEAAAGGELEHLLPGDVEGGEQLRVGEEAAQARHLGRRGVVHGGAARGRGVLGGLEVRRARQQLLQARQQVLRRGHAVRGARRGMMVAGGDGVDDDGEEEERGEVRAWTHRRRRRWRRLRNGRSGCDE